MRIESFRTREMMDALSLRVDFSGDVWSIDEGCFPIQKLSWTAEEVIAYVVGRMFDASIRERILLESAVYSEPPEESEVVRLLGELQKLRNACRAMCTLLSAARESWGDIHGCTERADKG